MNSNTTKLLHYLQEQNDWTTSSKLSLELNVSKRSIKNYISEIKRTDPNLILSSRDGYKINKTKISSFKESINTEIHSTPQNPQERIEYIIIKLINNTEAFTDIYELSLDMYISESTLKSDLRKVKRKCHEFNLELLMNGDNISIQGSEKNKRKIINSIIYSKLNKNLMNIDTIQNAFSDYDVKEIEKILITVFREYHYFINDYSLANLLLHITITIDRIKNNYVSEYIEKNNQIILKEHEYKIANVIAKELETAFNIHYNENEIYELAILIISNATNLDYKKVNKLNIDKLAGEECINLVHELIENINSYYHINLNDTEFFIRFALHIKNLLIRSKSNYYSKNPLKDSIKTAYPLIYDHAVNISYKIKSYTGSDITEDEIAYIALHIGSALVNEKNMHTKITCAILFPQYYDLNIQTAQKISAEFSESLIIKNIVTREQDLQNINVDFIISTINIIKFTNISSIIITPLLTEKDKHLILKEIDDIKHKKKRDQFLKYLNNIFNESLFLKNKDFKDENEAIDFMCDKMVQSGYISADFKKEVHEREKMSSTAFNRIAIPHSMHMDAIKTGMFAIINENSMTWGKQQVNIIFLLTVNKNERNVFYDVFDSLTNILSDDNNLKKILESSSFDSFINIIAECI